ncbi:MAG: hypothetical protein WCR30_03815 [Clostridia bacterium]
MTKEDRLKMYEEAIKKWGLNSQLDQLIEEMAELTIALSKYKRKYTNGEYAGNSKIDENLIEELADVSLVLEEMRIHFGEEKVEEIMTQKMKRLESYLSVGNKISK